MPKFFIYLFIYNTNTGAEIIVTLLKVMILITEKIAQQKELILNVTTRNKY